MHSFIHVTYMPGTVCNIWPRDMKDKAVFTSGKVRRVSVGAGKEDSPGAAGKLSKGVFPF